MNTYKPSYQVRQELFLKKYQKLRYIVEEHSLCRAWFEHWSRTNESTEEGLIGLVLILVDNNERIIQNFEDYMARSGPPIIKKPHTFHSMKPKPSS